MKVATHIVFGQACWFGTSALIDIAYGPGAVLICAAASILPDADYPTSWMGRQLGGASEWLHERFGHRSFLHSAAALGILGCLLYPLLALGYTEVWLAAMIGYGSHLMADMMTLGGVQLLWPSRGICVFPGRDEYRVKSGAASERVFVGVSLAAALILWPISATGLMALVYGLGDSPQEYAQVTRVIDGDTVEVEVLETTQVVRLIGVDTPETVHPEEPVECFGPESSDFVTERLEGETVQLVLPAVGDTSDHYGRTLAYIWTVEDGQRTSLFNETLLRRGYAETSGFSHEHIRRFERLESDARQRDVGMWSACQDGGIF